MMPPFLVRMIVGKVMSVLVDKIKIDKISDYVFNDNILDKKVKELRDDLDKIKERMIYLEKEKEK